MEVWRDGEDENSSLDEILEIVLEEGDDIEDSGKDKALSLEGDFVIVDCARAASPKFEAEVALSRGDFAGVGGLAFSVFSDVGV